MRTWIWIAGVVALAAWVLPTYAEDEAAPAGAPKAAPADGPAPGAAPQEQRAHPFVARAADKDRSGDVSAEEWSTFLDDLKKSFAKADANGDGALDAEELPRPRRRGGRGPMDRAGAPGWGPPPPPEGGEMDARGKRGRGPGGAGRGPFAGEGGPPQGMRGPRGRRAHAGGPPQGRGMRGPGMRGRGMRGRGPGQGECQGQGPCAGGAQAGPGGPRRGLGGGPGFGPGRGAGQGPGRGPGARFQGAPRRGGPDAGVQGARIDRLTAAIEALTRKLEAQDAK